MDIPNISGIKLLQGKTGIYTNIAPRAIGTNIRPVNNRPKITKKSSFIQDVTVLMTDYNDKAFLYDSGKVDIIKGNNLKTTRFKNKKDAALYLLRAGWKYV
jgi:hypothetical protein